MLPFANHHIIGTAMKMWRNRSIDLEKVRAAGASIHVSSAGWHSFCGGVGSGLEKMGWQADRNEGY